MKPKDHKSDMASGMKGPRTRALGSVRSSMVMDTVPKFPPLRPGNSIDGVMGSAMQVPPSKEPLPDTNSKSSSREMFKSGRNTSPKRRQSSEYSDALRGSARSIDSTDHTRELKDAMAREGKLKQQIMQLQKVIDDLKMQVADKDKSLAELQLQYERQELHFKEMYEQEQRAHADTSHLLQKSQTDVRRLQQGMEELTKSHQLEVDRLKQASAQELAEVIAKRDRDMAERDEKLNRLKKQMAEALKGNSWERQQQLDELTRELSKVQEEADMLRLKLKSISNKGKNGAGCLNCDSMTVQVGKSQKVISEKEAAIKDLKTLCSRFEKQLSQQDLLLQKLADNKSAKLAVLHK